MSIIIPTSPTDRKELYDAIQELSSSMTRVESEKDYQKDAVQTLADKFQIDKKFIRAMAMDYHKNKFKDKVGEFEDYTLLYENIMNTRNWAAGNTQYNDDDDEGDFDGMEE